MLQIEVHETFCNKAQGKKCNLSFQKLIIIFVDLKKKDKNCDKKYSLIGIELKCQTKHKKKKV